MKQQICSEFANAHCCSDDCPNIRFDKAAERFGDDIAEDAGYSRTSCSKCRYGKNPGCEDCLFVGSKDCPKESEETNVDTSL